MLALRNACRLSLAFRRRVIPRPPALKRCFVRREKAVCVQERRRFTSLSSRHSSAAASRLECSSDGKKCQVLWSDGEQSTYHAVWLRHNCQCPECRDDTANQKLVVDVNELRSDLRIDSVTGSGSSHKMDICWSYGQGEKEHRGYVNLEWLKKNSYSAETLQKLRTQSHPPIAHSLPQLSYAGMTEGEETVWKWMKSLNEYGICLVTDIPANLGEIKKLAKAAGGVQETYYGETFQVESKSSEKALNLAYTTLPLPFHNDLDHFESPPGLQLLHCIRNDDCVEGGESVLLDLLPVVEDMRRKFPQHFTTLTRVPATFERIHINRKIPVALRHRKPHIILDTSGEVSAISWHPQCLGPLQVPEEDVEEYYEAYFCLGSMIADSELKLYHRLKPGEAITFNNRRFVHSRTGFKLNGGSRHLEGVYVNIDTFKSKVRLLASRFEPEFTVKTVLNQDHGGYTERVVHV